MKNWILSHLAPLLFKAVESFLLEAWKDLSKASGRQGLDESAFHSTVNQVVRAQGLDDTGAGKAAWVAQWILKNYGDRVAPWVAHLLAYLAYLKAKKKGQV